MTRPSSERPFEFEGRPPAAPGFLTDSQLLSQFTANKVWPVEVKRTKLARLEELERSLRQLLETSAPLTWRAMQGPLTRIITRARRELRAAERLS